MIEIREIFELLPHRYPFLLVDRITELVPGKYVIAIKNVTANEPQFTGHFPENPIFPGIMLVEAMAQAAGILAIKTRAEGLRDRKAAVIAGIDNVRFRRPVVPGDQFVMRCEIVSTKRNIWKFRCVGTVDGFPVTEAEILCTERDI